MSGEETLAITYKNMKMVSFEVLKPRKLFYVTFILIFTQLWVNVLCGEKLGKWML